MKKILCLILVLLLLTGCAGGQTGESTGGTSLPTMGTTEATIPSDPTESTGSLNTEPMDPTETTQSTVATEPTQAPTETPTEPSEETEPTEAPTEPTEPESTDYLEIHYIDVGQADCALLESNGEYIIIDGGNVADSSLVVTYLLEQGVEELEAVIASHAHEDHVGGLPGVLAVIPTHAVYAPTRTYSSKCFDDFVYYTDQQGLQITIPGVGDVIEFGGATATVLGPVKSYADPNNTSIVLMVEFGDTRFLFTGDMETGAENDMLDHWGEKFDWHADVLKVGHHGSDTSTSYRFLNAVMPAYGIISVGAGNSYGHPHEVPLSRLEDADVTVYRTDELGTIVARSNGKTVSFGDNVPDPEPEKPTDPVEPTEPTEPAEPTDPTESTEPTEGDSDLYFIGNINSKKLHLPTCGSLPTEKNRVIFYSYEEAMEAGYTHCAKCMKNYTP